ncbi:hypothetical protein KUTeg_006493 [Tegillarca granosa]|uniref:Uncharacterized protein n=1 Tax=Tegillarca granosa TaxID=220873 RepID=A0ABQ9FGQ0_TEGGR|nr:hypothetical protein KUTeg_006493 [Tegillarca granosa]
MTMGNTVFAASSPPETPLGLAPPPLQPGASQATPASADATPQAPVTDINPGTFEDLHKQCKDLYPQTFEGGKFIMSQPLSSHFQLSHTLSMSMLQPLTSDPSGNLNANIIHSFTKNTRVRLVNQIQESKCVATQATGDYKGEDFTASLTLGNIDLVNNSGIIVGQYLQRVTSKLDLGAELLYQYGGQTPGGEFSVLTLASRLKGEKWTLSANICPKAAAVHACYYHKVDENLQVGAEIETSLATKESQADTNWSIGATFEKKLLPFPFTLAISGMANYASFQKPQYRFGIGLVVG